MRWFCRQFPEGAKASEVMLLIIVIGAAAMMAFTAAAFSGQLEFGNFSDAGSVAAGLEKYAGRLPGVLCALALIDTSILLRIISLALTHR